MATGFKTSMKRTPPANKYQGIANLIQKGLASLREDDVCTDFEVIIQEKSFRCHKIVLASVSDYFRAMFESGMKETTENQTRMDNISPEAFQVILDLLYYNDTVEDPLSDRKDEEMIELFRVADMFGMSFLGKLCIQHFDKSMNAENCVERWTNGKTAMIEDLVEMSWKYILFNFEKVVKASVLSSLEYKDFLTIIQDERLSVTNEIVVWKAIADWVDLDRTKRGDDLPALLQQCCLTEIDYQYLVEEMCYDERIRLNNFASRLLQAATKVKKHPGSYGNTEFKLRHLYMKEQVHVALGKAEGDQKFTMIGYSTRKQKFDSKDLPDKFPENRTGFACCVHERNIYVCGGTGYNGNTMHKYSCADDNWKPCSGKMPASLKRHALVATDDCLYAIGGESGYSINGAVFEYKLKTEQWDIHGDVLAPVEQPSAVCLNNRIYLIGGALEGKPDSIASDCVQVYDIETATGTILCNLPNPCKFSCAVGRLDEIYVATSNGEIIRLSGKQMNPELIANVPGLKDKKLFSMGMKCDILSLYGGIEKLADENLGAKCHKAQTDVVHINLKNGKVSKGKPLPKGYIFYGGVDAVVGSDLFNSMSALVY